MGGDSLSPGPAARLVVPGLMTSPKPGGWRAHAKSGSRSVSPHFHKHPSAPVAREDGRRRLSVSPARIGLLALPKQATRRRHGAWPRAGESYKRFASHSSGLRRRLPLSIPAASVTTTPPSRSLIHLQVSYPTTEPFCESPLLLPLTANEERGDISLQRPPDSHGERR